VQENKSWQEWQHVTKLFKLRLTSTEMRLCISRSPCRLCSGDWNFGGCECDVVWQILQHYNLLTCNSSICLASLTAHLSSLKEWAWYFNTVIKQYVKPPRIMCCCWGSAKCLCGFCNSCFRIVLRQLLAFSWQDAEDYIWKRKNLITLSIFQNKLF